MTLIENLEVEEGKRQASARVAAALFEGLNKEPENYEWTGEIVDMGPEGKCICGHPIRNGFPLEHKTKKNEIKTVGSSCVGYFQGVNEELYLALMSGLAALQKRIREAKAESKKAAAMQEVEVMRSRFEHLRTSMKDIHLSFKERGQKSPYGIWAAIASYGRAHVPSTAPEYSRPADFKRWYGNQIKYMESVPRESGYQR